MGYFTKMITSQNIYYVALTMTRPTYVHYRLITRIFNLILIVRMEKYNATEYFVQNRVIDGFRHQATSISTVRPFAIYFYSSVKIVSM